MTFPHISRITFSVSCGCICGIGMRSFFEVSYDVMLFLYAIIALGGIFAYYKRSWIWIYAVFMIGVIGGLTIAHNRIIDLNKQTQMIGQKIIGNAIISRDVEQKQWYANVYAVMEYPEITVMIKDDKYPRAKRGDRISLTCTLTHPEKIDDYDYRMYLAMQGVDYICEEKLYDVIGREEDIIVKANKMRQEWEGVIDRVIPSPQAALANGLLFGGDDRLSQELQDQFSRTGMTHVVAVSGYNVSIIIAMIMVFVIFCGAYRTWAVVISIIGVVGFVLLIGCPSSGVRAAIMGIIVLVAASFGRISHAYSGMCFAASLMLIDNPLLLRYDVGFQLSFLATVGIVASHTLFADVLLLKKRAFGIMEIIVLTVSAQIFVVPIIIYYFHTFATVSIITNILVLPIIPITMLCVFLLIVFSYICMPIAILCGWTAYFFLTYEITVIEFFASLSWSSVSVDAVKWWWVIGYYLVLFLIVYYSHYRYEKKSYSI